MQICHKERLFFFFSCVHYLVMVKNHFIYLYAYACIRNKNLFYQNDFRKIKFSKPVPRFCNIPFYLSKSVPKEQNQISARKFVSNASIQFIFNFQNGNLWTAVLGQKCTHTFSFCSSKNTVLEL